MKNTYNKTILACFIGYIVQAIVNNFVPLLFVTFQSTYGISIRQITLLVTVNFSVQLLVDLIAAKFADRIGYRVLIVAANLFAAVGLIGLTVLPEILQDPYAGLLLSVMVYAIGGGIIEVLVSPIVEACPTTHKEAVMSILHSFYCFGHVGVVIGSTLFFQFAGLASWRILALIWAVLPLINAGLFLVVPITSLIDEKETGYTISQLIVKRKFLLFFVLMLCAGACEQSVSQWASALCEEALGVGKTIGDLLGPLTFALVMGGSRAYYGKFGERINLKRFMSISTALCIVSYVMIGISHIAIFGFLGCALCGASVGILWPGTFSLASKEMPLGGTAMFALLALAGDFGCMAGPTAAGFISDLAADNLKIGILGAIVFPIILFVSLRYVGKIEQE